MIKQFIFSIGLLILGTSAFAGDAPQVVIENIIEQTMPVVRSKALENNFAKTKEFVDSVIFPQLNMEHMAQLATGKYWRNATTEQKREIARQFKDLLIQSYANVLMEYKNQNIQLAKNKSIKEADTETVIKSIITQPGAKPIPLDYSMELINSQWLIYDITVAGASLITNYRSAFSKEIEMNGIDGLIKSLQEKNAKQAHRK